MQCGLEQRHFGPLANKIGCGTAEENSAEENAAEAPAVWPPPPPVQCETPQSKPRRAVAQTAHPGVRPVVPLRPGRECPPPPSPQLATPRSPLAETQVLFRMHIIL